MYPGSGKVRLTFDLVLMLLLDLFTVSTESESHEVALVLQEVLLSHAEFRVAHGVVLVYQPGANVATGCCSAVFGECLASSADLCSWRHWFLSKIIMIIFVYAGFIIKNYRTPFR